MKLNKYGITLAAVGTAAFFAVVVFGVNWVLQYYVPPPDRPGDGIGLRTMRK